MTVIAPRAVETAGGGPAPPPNPLTSVFHALLGILDSQISLVVIGDVF